MNKTILILVMIVITGAMGLVVYTNMQPDAHVGQQAPAANASTETAPVVLEEVGDPATLDSDQRDASNNMSMQVAEKAAAEKAIADKVAAERAAAEKAAAEKAATERAAAEKAAAEKAATERAAAEKAAAEKAIKSVDRSKLPKDGKHTLKKLSLHFEGQKMRIYIEADTSFPYKFFVLKEPDRLVVDLPGTWENFYVPTVPQNKVVKAVRVGKQPGGPRLVFDLYASPKQKEITSSSEESIDILIQ